MVPRFYVERQNVYDRTLSSCIARCDDVRTANIIASMFNNRVRFNQPLHDLGTHDHDYPHEEELAVVERIAHHPV